MNEYELQLMNRVAKLLKVDPSWIKSKGIFDTIEMLCDKMENDMFDIEDMFAHLQNMKEGK